MHSHSSIPRSARRRASVLLVVVMMTLLIAIVIGSILTYGTTESRLNKSDHLMQEARLAAETTLNHGMAQLRRRFDRTRQLAPAELEPNRNSALRLEPGYLTFMSGSRTVVPASYTAPANLAAFDSAPTIVGGLVINGGAARNLTIDPFTTLPEQGGTDAATNTSVREVRVYAKATVQDRLLGTRTAYVRQTFQILDRSLFGNTVYFNGLLEIFPGADLNLGMGEGAGPIYAPDIRLGNNPSIHTRVESSGALRIGRYNNDSADDNDDARLRDFSVAGSAYLKTLKNIEGRSYAIQTGVEGFRELALQRFNGGLLTSEHGIVGQSAVGLEFLSELNKTDNSSIYETNGVYDQGKFDRLGGNFGHLLIEPSRSIVDTTTISDPQTRSRQEAFNEIEKNKWANLSSIAIEVIPHATNPANDTVRIFYQPTGAEGAPIFEANGQRQRQEITATTGFTNTTRFWTVERFAQSGAEADVTGGLYDFRQGEGSSNNARGRVNLIRVDMGKMRKWVEESWTAGELNGVAAPTIRNDWWNGGVYVKLPETSVPSREDRVVPANANWAVQVHNATTLPNRYVKDTDSPRGLTLSTNGALYVQGTYNAPGNLTWNSNTYATAPGAEVPAALVADAVMLLSNAWNNRNSGKSALNQRIPTPTTHSAAIIAGNVPSTSTHYSGGLENYPRFLERWGSPGVTHTYRGSLIRLFRSESFDRRWGFNNVYAAPNRQWSFHTGFATFAPPLDRGPRVYRRINFKELSQAEFIAETRALFPAATPTP